MMMQRLLKLRGSTSMGMDGIAEPRWSFRNYKIQNFADILEGSVGILNNYNLCHIKTIDWKEIITGTDAKYFYVYRFSEPERDCSACHESCSGRCWGEGIQNCQKFSKVNCSPQCHQGRCFGPKPRECCHLFCAGGCTGPKQSDCLVSWSTSRKFKKN